MHAKTDLLASDQSSKDKRVNSHSLRTELGASVFFWAIYVITDRFFHAINCSRNELFCDQTNNQKLCTQWIG